MRSHKNRLGAAAKVSALSLATLLATAACTDSQRIGFFPVDSIDATNHTQRMTDLWVGAWIAALAVGVITWVLILWCVVAYRRRKSDKGVPVQVRYHAPMEMMFTIIPVVMVAVLFFFTNRDITAIDEKVETPDVVVNVVGKQWSWDFNYVSNNVYEPGTQAQLTGAPGVEASLPTLYLPVDKTVRFQLTSRDVIHSFWIPAFLYKEDMIPGHTNWFDVTPTKIGEFQGKCAELCGEYHSAMLFNVKVVSQADYDAHMADLAAQGYTGQLDNTLNREQKSWSADTGEDLSTETTSGGQ
ncbi:cytochrome c oxidase subunit II [Micrococcales bacterium 31B]|nr:cytochrome c oxidase subunit II [Micrococcales bacterium 31B]